MGRPAALANVAALAASCSVDVDFEPHGEKPAPPSDSLGADGAGAALRRGTRLAYLMTLSEEPLDGDFVAQAIGEAAERL